MEYIQIHNLSASYGGAPVLQNIHAAIEKNSLTAIVGPNGAGKSTLLKCILGFIKPLSGKIEINSKTLAEVRHTIAYVPQISAVNWRFPITVHEVVLMGRYASLGWLKRPQKEDQRRAEQALRAMGLEAYAERQISQLSGGQKQRVFIARALCQDADLVMLDEPLAGVDQTSEKIIMAKLKELQKTGKTIVCVHHDLHTIRAYFDHILLINQCVVAEGTVAEAFTDENIEKAYSDGNDDTNTDFL